MFGITMRFLEPLSIPKVISRLLGIAVTAGCFLNLSHAAEVYLYPPKPTTLNIKQDSCSDYLLAIVGEIAPGDDERFSKKVEDILTIIRKKSCGESQLKTQLFSEGGNVAAALALGRAIRKADARVIVPGDSNCLSSCVFVLLAGVDRSSYGKVGVHRPYFEHLSDRANAEDVRKARDYFLSGIRAYLTEMDVSPQLLDIMLSVSPENMRILSESELLDLRIIGTDANYEERQVAKKAWFYGLTSADYRKRYAVAGRTCPTPHEDFDRWHICQIQTMLNISRYEAQRRWERSERCLDKPESNYVQCLRDYLVNGNLKP